MWHREKDFLSKEMYQLQKVKMQQVLKEIEQEESTKFDQQFYGELAYRNWLEEKDGKGGKPGIKNQKAGMPAPTAKSSKETKTKEPVESLQKANSVRPTSRGRPSPIPEESRGTTRGTTKTQLTGESASPKPPQSLPQTPYSRGTMTGGSGDDVGLYEKPEVKVQFADEQNTQSGTTPENTGYYNPNPWNVSTHIPPYEYLPNLPDYYPRDEYSMKPKYPILKGGVPAPNANSIPIRHEGVDPKAKLRMPKLSPQMLEKALMGDQDRPVVYKCKNIIDVQNRKHYGVNELSAKSETAIHLCDDFTSRMFKAALQINKSPSPDKVSSKSSLRSGSSSKSRLSTVSGSMHTIQHAHGDGYGINVDVLGVTSQLRKINKPDHYPNIRGYEYDLNLGQVAM